MKKLKIFILTLTVGLFATTSCKFGDINMDPTQLSDAGLNAILPAAMGQTVFNLGTEGGRAAGIFMQQLAGNEAQQLALQDYVVDQQTFDNFWAFGLYAGSMKDCDILITKGTQKNQPYYIGIGKILMAVNLGNATLCWGDIPYTQAFKGDQGGLSLKPSYDTQESIYSTIQSLLNDAITELKKPAVAGGPGPDDLLFDGDPAKWMATAYALKARYYMHLVKRDVNASAEALIALANAFQSNSDEPLFEKFGTNGANDANPLGQMGAQRPNTLIILPDFNANMDAKSDPRIPSYMAFDGTNWVYFTGPSGLFWTSYTSPIPLISYSEVKFLEAEARLRTNDAAGAATALAAAIKANMNRLGVDGTTYIASYGNFAGLSTTAEKLERIIEEKYYALYAQGWLEIWTDFRRTGYPVLTPNPKGINGADPSGVIPRRFPYPTSEKFSNTENEKAAADRQGGDLLDSDLWAFK